MKRWLVVILRGLSKACLAVCVVLTVATLLFAAFGGLHLMLRPAIYQGPGLPARGSFFGYHYTYDENGIPNRVQAVLGSGWVVGAVPAILAGWLSAVLRRKSDELEWREEE